MKIVSRRMSMRIVLKKSKIRLSYIIPNFNDRSALLSFILVKKRTLLDSFERFGNAIYLSTDEIKKIIRLTDKQDKSKTERRVKAINLLKEYLKNKGC